MEGKHHACGSILLENFGPLQGFTACIYTIAPTIKGPRAKVMINLTGMLSLHFQKI